MRDERGVLVGPHRVWLPERGYPGLAMSRAIGDGLASLCAPPALHALIVCARGRPEPGTALRLCQWPALPVRACGFACFKYKELRLPRPARHSHHCHWPRLSVRPLRLLGQQDGEQMMPLLNLLGRLRCLVS